MRDLTGQRFGRLVVLELHCKKVPDRRHVRYMWKCTCDCGKQTVCDKDNLIAGHSKSCGCWKVDWCKENKRTHGESRGANRSKEYRAWDSMKRRCLKPTCSEYKYYGGRGIKICQRWIDSYVAFLSDMGRMRVPRLTLGRIDNEGDYTPKNCRWESHRQQTRNYRRNKIIRFNNQSKPIIAWAEELGIPAKRLYSRLGPLGWSIERALTS